MIEIAPSILSADFTRLAEEIATVEKAGASILHVDVMDGRFVPNITVGLPVVKAIAKVTRLPIDAHLMIVEPKKFAEEFKKAGADHLHVHIEACPNLHRNIQQIKELGMKAGVAINPHTPVTALSEVLHELDIVLIMSVNPGFGGQTFISHTLEKIKQLRRLIDEKGLNVLIEIDGGVTIDNAASIVAAGADVLVAGNTVFNSKDPLATISALKRL